MNDRCLYKKVLLARKVSCAVAVPTAAPIVPFLLIWCFLSANKKGTGFEIKNKFSPRPVSEFSATILLCYGHVACTADDILVAKIVMDTKIRIKQCF